MVNFFYLDKNPIKCAEYYCNKHVNKIFIEICQLLCNVVHRNTNMIPPYKNCKNISNDLAPYKWANYSLGNYKYLINLGINLLKQYKLRYNKTTHKSEKVINWLKNNIPTHFKHKKRTKLFYTKNIHIFKKYFNDDIEAFRYIYVIYKCKNDKWSIVGKPYWFDPLFKKAEKYRKKYKLQLDDLVKKKLPNIYKNNQNIKVKRFHSFLRIIYDNLFGKKWITYIKQYKNMYNINKPLIDQLSYIHLQECIKIGNLLKIEKNLIKYNYVSLKFRNIKITN